MQQKLKYLARDIDRHGTERFYVRRGRKKIRIPTPFNSPQFWKAYDNAVALFTKGHARPSGKMHLYVVTINGKSEPVKIGITEDPVKRLGGLQNGNPERLSMTCFALLPRADAVLLEREVHAHFAAVRLIGEWFKIPFYEVVEQIEKMAPNAGAGSHFSRVSKGGTPEKNKTLVSQTNSA